MLVRLRSLSKATRVLYQVRAGTTASGQRFEVTPQSNFSNTEIAATLERDDAFLVVQWKDNSVSRFPYIYLRDLCTCHKCINQKSLERLSDTVKNVPLSIHATNVEISNGGGTIKIKWPDDHVSEFDSDWLHEKKLLEKKERDKDLSTSSIAREGVVFWNRSDMQDNIPRFNFNKVMTEDSSLFEWLQKLHSHGIALLDGVPGNTEASSVASLAKRVGYIKSTHYGETFDVNFKFGANNLAYTTKTLPLHCDIPQSQYYPGIQFLHCIQQAPVKGGANMFVDGFYISQEFKDTEPELFDLLSTAPVPYWDIGKDDYGDFHLKHSRPSIELDQNGKITRYTYNNHVRDYHLSETPERVQEIYRGYLKLGRMMRDPKHRIDYKMEAGEMVTFNNSRVLHGRTAYTVTESGNRHLQGCYLDWDLAYARLRSLARLLGRPFVG